MKPTRVDSATICADRKRAEVIFQKSMLCPSRSPRFGPPRHARSLHPCTSHKTPYTQCTEGRMEVQGRKEGVRRLSDRECYRASPVPHPAPVQSCRACAPGTESRSFQCVVAEPESECVCYAAHSSHSSNAWSGLVQHAYPFQPSCRLLLLP